MVGMTGFEPATTWSQTKCSTKLSHIPKITGTYKILTYIFAFGNSFLQKNRKKSAIHITSRDKKSILLILGVVIVQLICYNLCCYGGIGEVVNTPDCGSGMQGFDPLIPPQIDYYP